MSIEMRPPCSARTAPSLGNMFPWLRYLDLTRFGGQFVVSLSDSLPSSNV